MYEIFNFCENQRKNIFKNIYFYLVSLNFNSFQRQLLENRPTSWQHCNDLEAFGEKICVKQGRKMGHSAEHYDRRIYRELHYLSLSCLDKENRIDPEWLVKGANVKTCVQSKVSNLRNSSKSPIREHQPWSLQTSPRYNAACAALQTESQTEDNKNAGLLNKISNKGAVFKACVQSKVSNLRNR
ncbi:hypothetical protein C0J52_27509 [Blattella germanica]|nr:hypothetical protein C0J52_27509 [Blattella germanica]